MRALRSLIKRAGVAPALALISLTALAGPTHRHAHGHDHDHGHGHSHDHSQSHQTVELPSGIHRDLAGAIKAQHEHDFVSARRLLSQYLDHHPGDPQALLVRAAVESATGHFEAARASCAPLIAQVPQWVVAACLGQMATGERELRTTLELLETIPDERQDATAEWARDIADELRHRLDIGRWQPYAPHAAEGHAHTHQASIAGP